MGAEIDRLEVGVEASAAKADAEMDKLIRRLEKVSDNLTRINGSGLAGFAKGIENLGKSMQTINSTKTSDFTRLAKNIEKITGVDSVGLNRTASSLNTIAKSVNNAGAAMKSSESIATLSSNLGKLGGKSIEKAITNLPKLATELKNLMTTLSQSPNVSKNVIQMTNALANLSNSMKGSSTSSNSKGESSVNKLSNAFSNLSGNIKKSRKVLSSFSQLAGTFYSNYFMLIRAMNKIKSSIITSMDYAETYNYFSVTMDKIGRDFGKNFEKYGYDSADAYASSFKDRMNELTRKMTGYNVGSNGELFMTDSVGLGLDPELLMKFQARIGAVTNAVGLCGEVSVNTADALSRLSADMSSLTNTNIESVMTNFQSGLIGQSRALYKYGIDITNANLQNYAYGLGLSKAVSEMNQAEKMQLRLIAILDQSKVAWGDQARTINSVANQYRIFKQQVSNLARVIGNLFLPIVQKVLPVVNGLVIALQRLFTTLGFKLWGGNWLKDIMSEIGGGYADDSLGDLVDSADDTADGLKNASKAAEKLKTMVLGIDELNIISPDDTSSSGVSGITGGGIDLSGAIDDALAEYKSVWEEAFKNAENTAQEFADKICNIFSRIWVAIEPFRNALKKLWDEGLSLLMGYTFQNLLDFYNLFLVPIGKWAFGTEDSGLTRLANIINERLMQIDWVWISDNLRKFWKAIEPYAEQFGEGLIDFFEDISKIPVSIINAIFGRDGAITGITDWLNSNDSEKARKWGYALGELAIGLMALKSVGTVIIGIAGIGTALSGIASGIGFLFGEQGIIASIASQVTKLFAPFTDKILEIVALVTGGAGSISEAFGVVFGISLPLASAFAALAAGIAYVFATNEEVRKSFSDLMTTLAKGFLPVIEMMTGEILPMLSEAFTNLWNNALVPLVELIGDVLSPLLLIISEALTVLCENIVIPLANALGTVFVAAVELVIDIFGKCIEKVNAVIKVFQFMWNDVMIPIVNYLWNTFKPIFENVFNLMGEMIDNLGLALSGLIKFITGVFTGDWEKAWNGVKDIFKGIFNGLISIAEFVINRIIDGINKFIEGFNGIVSKIGDVIGIDIEIPVIHSVSLPRFEKGGYPETGQLFLARENGINEMIGRIGNRSAVANNDQIVESVKYGVRQGVADAVSEILAPYLSDIARNTRETADKDFTVNIGDREISRANERGRSDRGYVLVT